MTDNNQPLGLIGLGLLGSAIADRLLAAGYSVLGFDLDADKCEALKTQGGQPSGSVSQVLAACSTIVLSLPTSAIVRDLIRAHHTALRHDHLFLDTTTGDPSESMEIGEWLAQQQVGFIEAKVAGSSAQLRRGEATLLVAGDEKLLLAHTSLFATLAQQHFKLGPLGAASKFKLVHNLVLGLHRAVLAEGLHFAQALGLDLSVVLATLQETPAVSRVMPIKGPKMIARDYSPQATVAQHLKDVDLILAAAARAGITAPLSALHRELLASLLSSGHGLSDNSAIFEAFPLARIDPGP